MFRYSKIFLRRFTGYMFYVVYINQKNSIVLLEILKENDCFVG